jgi:hypothetical protein
VIVTSYHILTSLSRLLLLYISRNLPHDYSLCPHTAPHEQPRPSVWLPRGECSPPSPLTQDTIIGSICRPLTSSRDSDPPFGCLCGSVPFGLACDLVFVPISRLLLSTRCPSRATTTLRQVASVALPSSHGRSAVLSARKSYVIIFLN